MNPAQRTEINRANSSHSTGPVSPEGKRRCSLNALRHGLTGRTVVLPAEDLAHYREFCQRYHDELQPTGILEESMVQSIADCAWRLERLAALESNVLSLDLAENAAALDVTQPDVRAALVQAKGVPNTAVQLERLSLYGQRISRLMDSTLRNLREMQNERRAREASDMIDAVDLRKFHQSRNIPWNPAEDGFVLSTDRIDGHIRRSDRLSRARQA